ncbi:hypothetical protein HMI56_003949 [Coelomomyces lativittatus]|nr:hypothetical protein HMI56_003949 [Coelomomyces lativittatus]
MLGVMRVNPQSYPGFPLSFFPEKCSTSLLSKELYQRLIVFHYLNSEQTCESFLSEWKNLNDIVLDISRKAYASSFSVPILEKDVLLFMLNQSDFVFSILNLLQIKKFYVLNTRTLVHCKKQSARQVRLQYQEISANMINLLVETRRTNLKLFLFATEIPKVIRYVFSLSEEEFLKYGFQLHCLSLNFRFLTRLQTEKTSEAYSKYIKKRLALTAKGNEVCARFEKNAKVFEKTRELISLESESRKGTNGKKLLKLTSLLEKKFSEVYKQKFNSEIRYLCEFSTKISL